MMCSFSNSNIAAVCTAFLFAFRFSGFAIAQPPTNSVQPSGAISVHGTQLFRDGRPFLVKGLQIVAFVGSPKVLESKPWYFRAYQHFGQNELNIAASSWHANTILFKLGQPELDPKDSLYTDAYIHEVTQAVHLARSMGFTVIVSVDELPPSGTSSQSPLPTEATIGAVKTLARLFGNDLGVMIEPYNEPFSPSCADAILKTSCSGVTPGAWAWWRDGSPDGAYVGVNALIKSTREAGAKNVILVQPLGHGGNFDGFPGGVLDPLDKIVYAVHPYFLFAGTSPASWDTHFGNFSATFPLIADEWGATSKAKMCSNPPKDVPMQFLQYIAQKNIGLIVWALDLPGTVVKDYHGTPNTLDGLVCGDAGGGAGELITQFFAGMPSSTR